MFVPERCGGESVSVVDRELLSPDDVGEGDDAVHDAEARVVEQVELAVGRERVRDLHKWVSQNDGRIS